MIHISTALARALSRLARRKPVATVQPDPDVTDYQPTPYQLQRIRETGSPEPERTWFKRGRAWF